MAATEKDTYAKDRLRLDEIAELPRALQTRLLRLVQEGTWRPVGADAHERADVRIVAATWKDLQGEVREGRFREDLYHRLAVVELELPALRDRGEDVRLLAEHFLHTESKRLGRTPPKLSHRLFNHLDKLSWPGNVRELFNVVHGMIVNADDEITVRDVPDVHPGPSDYGVEVDGRGLRVEPRLLDLAPVDGPLEVHCEWRLLRAVSVQVRAGRGDVPQRRERGGGEVHAG